MMHQQRLLRHKAHVAWESSERLRGCGSKQVPRLAGSGFLGAVVTDAMEFHKLIYKHHICYSSFDLSSIYKVISDLTRCVC